jgi:hypothetical protein
VIDRVGDLRRGADDADLADALDAERIDRPKREPNVSARARLRRMPAQKGASLRRE